MLTVALYQISGLFELKVSCTAMHCCFSISVSWSKCVRRDCFLLLMWISREMTLFTDLSTELGVCEEVLSPPELKPWEATEQCADLSLMSDSNSGSRWISETVLFLLTVKLNIKEKSGNFSNLSQNRNPGKQNSGKTDFFKDSFFRLFFYFSLWRPQISFR